MRAYYEEEKIFKSVEGGLKQTPCDLLGHLVHAGTFCLEHKEESEEYECLGYLMLRLVGKHCYLYQSFFFHVFIAYYIIMSGP